MIKIFENTPYRLDKDLITAYNEFMELLPDNSWALFRDADTLFLDSFYGEILYKAIENNPNTGCFTCLTNRIGCEYQLYNEYKGDDINQHRLIANKIKTLNNNKYTSINNKKQPFSGMLMLLNKTIWNKIGGFKQYKKLDSKILGVDNQLFYDLIDNNIEVKIINELYIYHWYRGGDIKNTTHLK